MSNLRSPGSLFILSVLGVYTLSHWALMIPQQIGFKDGLFYQAGAMSLICMAFAILISVRPKLVEGAFGGLDRMYQVHKWLGIAAMLFFALHFALSMGGGEGPDELPITAEASLSLDAASSAEVALEDDDEGGLIGPLGMYPMIGFFILIILTLNRKFAYHRWLYTHLLMGVLFAAVCLHAFLVLQEGEEIKMGSIPGIIILTAIAAGLLAYIYKQTLYRATQRHAFKLAEVNAMERATELVLKPEQKRFEFEPGQFAFLKIKDDGFDEAHPFTISSGTKDGNLRVTMKVLGDFTRRVRDSLTPGAKVQIEGPYGRFNPLKDANTNQVWIAGGIGITPFLSTLRSLEPGHRTRIDLFYCVREAAEALFWQEIQTIAKTVGGVNVHLYTSDTGGRLTADELKKVLGDDLTERSYYFCGPKPMRVALMNGLNPMGVQSGRFHYEEFEMR